MRKKVQVTVPITDAHNLNSHTQLGLQETLKLPDSICESLFLWHTVDYCTDEEFHHLLSKVAHGGEVAVYGYDLYDIARQLHSNATTMDQFKDVMFQQGRTNMHTVNTICGMLQDRGFQILTRDLKNRQYHISAVRE